MAMAGGPHVLGWPVCKASIGGDQAFFLLFVPHVSMFTG